MRRLKELFAWGGCDHKEKLYNDEGWEEPWEIHRDVHEAVLEMTLQGIGLSGSTVDLDVGTAIFARHKEKIYGMTRMSAISKKCTGIEALKPSISLGTIQYGKKVIKKLTRVDQQGCKPRVFFGCALARNIGCEQ